MFIVSHSAFIVWACIVARKSGSCDELRPKLGDEPGGISTNSYKIHVSVRDRILNILNGSSLNMVFAQHFALDFCGAGAELILPSVSFRGSIPRCHSDMEK